MGKIIFEAAQSLPLDRLVASNGNVRRVKAGVSIAELAEDIGRRGLLQSLSVRPLVDEAGTETGRYAVVAGGRRLAALQLLAKGKRLNKTAPVPCIVGHAEIAAAEDSLAENTMREALHPLDQYRAFRALREEHGLGEEEIAARFFVAPTVVRQRLRLASVSQRLLDLYAEDELTLDQLMAFAGTADHVRQEQVWEALSRSHRCEPYAIRRMLHESCVNARDKRAAFVGLAAYEAAGGVVERDLFAEDGGGYLRDPALLARLTTEKLAAEAERVRLEGWLWVEAALDLPYGHAFGMRRLAPAAEPLGEEAQAERDRLQAEYDGLEATYATSEDLPDEADRRLAEIEARLTELDATVQSFDSAEVARAGAFVGVDYDGSLRIERGFVRPADEPCEQEPEGGGEGIVGPEGAAEPSSTGASVVGATGAEDGTVLPAQATPDEEEPDDGGRLPERLLTDLSAHRTLALRAALSADPDAAILALLHVLALWSFYGTDLDSCIDVDGCSVLLDHHASGLGDTASGRALVDRFKLWQAQLPRQPQELWAALVALDPNSRMALLAVCVGRSVNALVQSWDRRPRAVAHADQLAALLHLEMAADGGWTPTIDSYLGRVTKARILGAVQEACGTEAAERIVHLRKPEMAESAERLLAGTGWLPAPLRTPGLTPTGAEAVREAEGCPEDVDALDGAAVNLGARDSVLVAAE